MESLFNKVVSLQAWNSNTGVFLWDLQNYWRTSILKKISNDYFWKILPTNFNNSSGNSIKDCISLAALLVEGFVQGAQRMKPIIAPFVKRFKSSYFVKF